MKKKFFSALLLAVSLFPLSLSSCDDDQNGLENKLLGYWIDSDSTKVTETLYWYDYTYAYFVNDAYYTINISVQNIVKDTSEVDGMSYELVEEGKLKIDGRYNVNYQIVGDSLNLKLGDRLFSSYKRCDVVSEGLKARFEEAANSSK